MASFRDQFDTLLPKWGYRLNGTKKILELNFDKKPVVVIYLGVLQDFLNVLTSTKADDASGLPNAAKFFADAFRKRYPTSKRHLKDFTEDEKASLKKMLLICEDFNTRFPEAHLTPQRYMKLHFAFYAANFGTAPKPSFFVTDNAVIRTTNFLETFDGRWPGDDRVETYFQNNLSPASAKAKKSTQEATRQDLRLIGSPIFLTQTDREYPLRDNQKFQRLKAKVMDEEATIYEARYVRDCYSARSATEQMDSHIDEYIAALETLAEKNQVTLK